MKRLFFILFLSLNGIQIFAQGNMNHWVDSIASLKDFTEVDVQEFHNWDFSELLSNQERMENDPISSYTGFFGPKFRRIDFHFKADKNNDNYLIKGKSKLGENIQVFEGDMKLKRVFLRPQEYITDSLYIGLFECQLNEPKNKKGDGQFSGVFTLVFYRNQNGIQKFQTSSGDEPSFTNTFVGVWSKYDSDTERRVIFSYRPSGLYSKLPYCESVYDYEFDDYTIIKEAYKKYGWEEYSPNKKNKWWTK